MLIVTMKLDNFLIIMRCHILKFNFQLLIATSEIYYLPSQLCWHILKFLFKFFILLLKIVYLPSLLSWYFLKILF